ncbi:MAG TPA: hypothetical protein VLX92_23965 [Kofleriaceae bacterium]|nr:hypothetical protein [Kofleriaceae bacterium]
MLHAVQAPVLKLVVVGGAAAALALGFAGKPSSHLATHRLSLHAPVDPNAYYMTAFEHGDVTITRDDSDLRAFTITTRAEYVDHCTWLGIEHFVPETAHRYAYTYDEQILSCAPGATPAYKTPRSGYVTVDE